MARNESKELEVQRDTNVARLQTTTIYNYFDKRLVLVIAERSPPLFNQSHRYLERFDDLELFFLGNQPSACCLTTSPDTIDINHY